MDKDLEKDNSIKKVEATETEEVNKPEETSEVDETEEVAVTENELKKEETKETDEVEIDEETGTLKSQKQSGQRGWYVIHTYSGYEEQVAENLKQRIESLGMEDRIFQVLVPKEKQIEIKNGKRRTVEKRIFPGYVLVEMIVTDDSWYVVRNTPNVTGFIGLGVRPTPMLPDEIDRIRKRMGVEEPKYKIEFRIGDLVQINDGPLKGFEAKVTEIDDNKGKIKVLVSMFGRETPVSLDFLQVKKV